MNRLQELHKPFVRFGNPFRTTSPKDSCLSPKLSALLNYFELTLAERLKKLKPADSDNVFCLPWMRSAMESLTGVHSDMRNLITALEFSVSDWDIEWIDVYLSNTVSLLDICTAFSSEIGRLKQSHLYLRCALLYLNKSSPDQFILANASLEGWNRHRTSKNLRLENCFSILDSLVQMLELPKVKNSAKGKVLMQAMYGVKVITFYICRIFAVMFSGCSEKLTDLHVPGTCLWAEAFNEFQSFVKLDVKGLNGIGRMKMMEELEAVDPVEVDLINLRDSLEKSIEECSDGLDRLGEEVESFFQIVLKGRDELQFNVRTYDRYVLGKNQVVMSEYCI